MEAKVNEIKEESFDTKLKSGIHIGKSSKKAGHHKRKLEKCKKTLT